MHMIFRPTLLSARRRSAALLFALPLSGAACSDHADESVSDVSANGDATTGETSDEPDAKGSGFQRPEPYPGDPLAIAGQTPLAAPLSLGALTATAQGALTTDGMQVLAVNVDGKPDGAPVLTAPEALLAVARNDDDVYVVTRSGMWRRASDGKEVAGPRVNALHAADSGLIGLLGRAGIAVADAALDVEPTTTVLAGSVVRDLAFVGDALVIAGGPAGVQRVVIGPDRAVTVETSYATALPVTAVAALGADHVVAVEAGASIQVLALAQGGFEKVGSLEHDGPGLDVAVLGDGDTSLAVIADTDRATLVDLRDPAAPRWVASQTLGTNGALSVIATSAGVLVRGASAVTALTPALDAIASAIAVEPALIQIEALADLDAGASGVLMRNPGALPLELTEIILSDPRLTANTGQDEGEAIVVEPGDVAFFEIRVAGTAPLEATLSFKTNAVDAPNVSVPVQVNPARLKQGDLAPPFTLVGTEGELVTIGELMGSVIHAKLFNAY